MLQDGREIARVHYALTTSREIFSTSSHTRGYVRPVKGQIEVGEEYVLRLENGKELEFYARHTNGIDYPWSTYTVTVNDEPEV